MQIPLVQLLKVGIRLWADGDQTDTFPQSVLYRDQGVVRPEELEPVIEEALAIIENES